MSYKKTKQSSATNFQVMSMPKSPPVSNLPLMFDPTQGGFAPPAPNSGTVPYKGPAALRPKLSTYKKSPLNGGSSI